MERKMLPIGLEDFGLIRTENFYYVDKTGMIRELLSSWGAVNLFTRPRRFGKSLNMSMLKYFFEIGQDPALFDGLSISDDQALCEKYMGRFPVVSLTLKGVEGADFSSARAMAVDAINEEARRLRFLEDSEMLSKEDKKLFRTLLDAKMSDRSLVSSIRNITELLEKHFGKKVIVLIDEYDVPLAKANQYGYYDEMVLLIRGLMHQALKTNSHLYFAVLTGCLRVSEESIFTGLNNLKTYSLSDEKCEEWFGFTDAEVRDMLTSYGLMQYYDVTKEWYDGYRIGGASVYNPWDVINWCEQLLTGQDKEPRKYWVNSSENMELKRFIRRLGDGVTKLQMEQLISGEAVQKTIEEQMTYNTMYDSIENMWSLLYATGYLTRSEVSVGTNMASLVIPNQEVRYIFSDLLLKLFEAEVAADGETVDEFTRALKSGDTAEVERLFTKYLDRTVGVRDTAVQDVYKEHFYHGILLGILAFKSTWNVASNGSAGDGYFDIIIEIEENGIGIVIEVKYAKKEQYDAACRKALKQIDDKDYTAKLRQDDMHTILKYGIACYKRKCRVKLERQTYDRN